MAAREFRLTWRARTARAQAFYEAGEVLFIKVKSLLVVGAALKILGLSLWTIAALTPALLVAYMLLGWWWVRRGWYRETQEVSLIGRWTPMQVNELWFRARAAHALGFPLNGYDPETIPPEFTDVFVSAKR